jgi:exosome complex exonuclease DIS3/RRP44
MNRAFDGDIVAVQLVAPAVVNENPNEETDPMFEIDNVGKKKQSATKEAKVVAILRRNLRQFCGYLIDGGLFQPLDARVPRIKIKTQQQRNNELVNQLLVVAVDTWPIESRNPLGHYVQTIGAVGDLAAENEAILREHEVPFTPFPTAALSCLPAEDWCITQDEINKRTDVRSRRVCSIDPPGCKDIDDALHVQLVAVPKKWTISKATIPTPSPGTSSFAEYDFRTVRMIEKAEDAREDEDVYYEVGVHIADVSHFVAPGSALDDEASRRCTTVYLVDRRIDMLPSVLTEHLCSLNANVERLAFSVLWYLHCDSLVIQHAYYCKSVIRSRAALTYGEAQSLLDGKPLKDEFTNPHANKGQKPADLDLVHLTQDVRTMVRLGRHLKALRFDAGALALASAEVKFTDGDMSLYTLYETNSTVEELMLLANVSVAAKTAESFPAHAILRRHPPPEPHAFDRLVSIAQAEPLNYSWFDASTSKALNESLDRVPDAAVQRLLRMLATRCMQQALYMAAGSVKRDEWRHYGLAADVYTHFTSPIRRYADVMVHRLLAAALELVPLTAVLRGKDDVVEIVDNMNKRHLMAQLAGRASTDLHTVLFFKEKGEVVAEGVVMGVAEKGEWANVFVERYGLEGRVEEGATGAKVFERRKVRIQPGGRKLKIEWVASDNNVTAAAAAAESTTVGVTATTTEIRPPSAKKARRS